GLVLVALRLGAVGLRGALAGGGAGAAHEPHVGFRAVVGARPGTAGAALVEVVAVARSLVGVWHGLLPSGVVCARYPTGRRRNRGRMPHVCRRGLRKPLPTPG